MKSAGKVYKGGIVQIVSSPDSSSTIWKSCTTFGRRNYLLRLSQILHDDRHFLFQETVAILVITQSIQLFHQWTAAKHPTSTSLYIAHLASSIYPRDKEAAPKFYGRVQANGDVSIRKMSERIQQTCTVHKADVQAVLLALEDVITDALKGGEIVRLGDLGTLQIGISSKGP